MNQVQLAMVYRFKVEAAYFRAYCTLRICIILGFRGVTRTAHRTASNVLLSTQTKQARLHLPLQEPRGVYPKGCTQGILLF